MNKAMKTKDMAQTLGVSQTTVKRWVSHYPDSFRKDRYGHYVFSEQDVERVRHIKLMVEQGMALDEISLSEIGHSMTMETAAAAERTADACGGAFGIADDLQVTIARIEAALSPKADDGVTFPFLKQREELEDIRKTVERLTETVEALRKQVAPMPVIAAEPPAGTAAAASSASRRRKRSLLRNLFPF